MLVPVGAGLCSVYYEARWGPAGRQHGRRCRPSGGALLAIPQPATWETCVLGATCDETCDHQRWANWPEWGLGIWGGSSSRTGGTCGLSLLQAETDLIPFLPLQGPRLEPHDLDHGPRVHAGADRFPFPQGFTFLRLPFFALHVHPLFGTETAPLSRLCRGASETGRLGRLTPRPGQIFRVSYGDGRTDSALAGRLAIKY